MVKFVNMPDTVQESYTYMHAQEKNVQNTIFGGYIMKMAFELAFLSVRKYSGQTNPQIQFIDTINFFKPVQIG